jgi:hypothetical protein
MAMGRNSITKENILIKAFISYLNEFNTHSNTWGLLKTGMIGLLLLLLFYILATQLLFEIGTCCSAL